VLASVVEGDAVNCSNFYCCLLPGAQPALHFGGRAIFMNFYLMTSSRFFNRGTTFSQTVTDMFFSQHFRK